MTPPLPAHSLSRASRCLARRWDVLLLGAFLLTIGVIGNRGLLTGGFCYDESFFEYLAWRFEAARLVRAGEWPFFTDRIFAGTPLMSTGYVGVFYPPNWLYLVSPPELLNWLGLFHTIVAGFGMRAYLRTWRLAPVPLLLGTVWFATGTFLINHTGHVSMREAACLAPWVAWATRRVLRRPCARRAGVLAAAIALQTATGYLQVLLFTVVWVFFEWLAVSRFTWRFGRATLWTAAAGLVGVGLLSMTLLPTLAHVAQTPRAEMDLAHWQFSSFPPGHALLFLNPAILGTPLEGWIGWHQFSWELLITVSPTAWVLALAAPVLVWRRGRRRSPRLRATFVFVLGMGVTFLLALGSHFAPNALLFNVPPFNFFRVPSRWLFLTSGVFSPILAAFALQEMLRLRARARLLAFGAGWFDLFLLTLGAHIINPLKSISLPLHELLVHNPLVWWWYGSTLAAGLSLLALRRWRGLAPGVLLVLALGEFVLSASGVLLPPGNADWEIGRAENPVLAPFPPHAVTRVFGLHPGHPWGEPKMIPPNINVFRGYRHLGGYTPMRSYRLTKLLPIAQTGRSWEELMLLDNPTPLHVGAVSHLLIANDRMNEQERAAYERSLGSDYQLVGETMGVSIVTLNNAPPRVHLAAGWRPVNSIDEMIRDNWEPWPPMTRRHIPVFSWDLPPGDVPSVPPNVDLGGGWVDPAVMQSGRQIVRVGSNGPGLLVVRDTYWEGWKYRLLNGSEEQQRWRPVMPVQGFVRGVPLPDGVWEVEMRYFPPGWDTGKWLSFGAALLLLVLLTRGEHEGRGSFLAVRGAKNE
ncbi:MAG: hypothetical protein PWP23_2442 [Candidatus Sumerlaeota bacterium]|nr:hypothetical protein [Candidatus Sumerlaeota bacterium]